MQHDPKELPQLALNQPWLMFTGEEIAEICNVSQNVITRFRTSPDSPFFLNKCRPEWFVEWMHGHHKFQLTKADIQKIRTLEQEKKATNVLRNFNSSSTSNQLRRPKRRPKTPKA